MARSKDKTKAKITKLGKNMQIVETNLTRSIHDILSDLKSGFYSESSASIKTLIQAGQRLQWNDPIITFSDVLYEMFQLLAVVDWNGTVLWKEDILGEKFPRIVLSNSYYDDELKKNNYPLWESTFIDGVANEDDFLTKFIVPYVGSIDKCKELVGKAKKGTLVYTDIPLIQKLESAPKVNLNGENDTDKDDILPCDNIVRGEHFGNSQDYIFGRLKRDAELGDSKAQEVVDRVKRGSLNLHK